jgi:hypothetical protein
VSAERLAKAHVPRAARIDGGFFRKLRISLLGSEPSARRLNPSVPNSPMTSTTPDEPSSRWEARNGPSEARRHPISSSASGTEVLRGVPSESKQHLTCGWIPGAWNRAPHREGDEGTQHHHHRGNQPGMTAVTRPQHGRHYQPHNCAKSRDDRGPSSALRAAITSMVVGEIRAAIRTRRHV